MSNKIQDEDDTPQQEEVEVESKATPIADGWRLSADSRQWTLECRRSSTHHRSKKGVGGEAIESWGVQGCYGSLEQALNGFTQARVREGVGLHELGLEESVRRAVGELRAVLWELKEATKVEVRL